MAKPIRRKQKKILGMNQQVFLGLVLSFIMVFSTVGFFVGAGANRGSAAAKSNNQPSHEQVTGVPVLLVVNFGDEEQPRGGVIQVPIGISANQVFSATPEVDFTIEDNTITEVTISTPTPRTEISNENQVWNTYINGILTTPDDFNSYSIRENDILELRLEEQVFEFNE